MQTGACYKRRPVSSLLTGCALLVLCADLSWGQTPPREIQLDLGDYRYTPQTIEVEAGRSVILSVTNKDGFTPHNFTLQDAGAGLDIDRDVDAGTTVRIEFIPQTPGSYTFYCNKKLPFMKSHRERGMEGTLIVRDATPE